MIDISQQRTLSALAVGLLGLALFGCAQTSQVQTKLDKPGVVETKPKWDYSEQSGPGEWGKLSPDYVLAAIGSSQSPIDIVTEDVITADLPSLKLETRPAPLKVLDNGHTVEVIAPAGSTLQYGKQTFTLKQYHFHAPSEHTINGKHAKVEVHFVYSDGAGQLAVIGVLVEEGEEDNPIFLSILEDQAPTKPGEMKVFPNILVDIKEFFPSRTSTSCMTARSPRHRLRKACAGLFAQTRSTFRAVRSMFLATCITTTTDRCSLRTREQC